jgi:NADPH:quinone reductase-like Zn-dependent oxidoreductase
MKSPTLPSQRRAIVKESPRQATITSVPMPDVPPGYLLVQTHYVALNPADWTDIDGEEYIGCVIGLDYAGTVVQVGEQVNRAFKSGDRGAGISHGCNILHPDYGAFSEYILVKADAQMKVPGTMNLEEAASMGVGVITATMGLYRQLGLPLPGLENVSSNDPEWILIYGGSSATGSLAIQFAKL